MPVPGILKLCASSGESYTVFEGTPITISGVPSQDVGAPKIGIEATCVPVLFCVGPAAILPTQDITETPPVEEQDETVDPVAVDPVCILASQACLEPMTFVEEEEVPIGTPPV